MYFWCGGRGLGLSHQGAELMAKYGVRVPPGIACATPEEVAAAAAKLSGESGEVVVKSQVRENTSPTPCPFPTTPHTTPKEPFPPPHTGGFNIFVCITFFLRGKTRKLGGCQACGYQYPPVYHGIHRYEVKSSETAYER